MGACKRPAGRVGLLHGVIEAAGDGLFPQDYTG